MKQIDKFCCCIFSLFLMVACQEEEIMDKTAGFQVSLQDMGVAIETKSTPAELGKPLADQFKLKVVKNGDSSPLFDGNYTSQTIPASAGTYTISASYGDNPVLALDAPYYLGDTTNVVIKEGEQKKITLSCKVANALASASFPTDTELKKIFSSYWVKVVVGKSSCKLTSDSKKSAYFQAEKQVAFYFEGTKVSGKDFSEELKHKDLPSVLKAGHHVKLTLKLSDDLLLDVAKVEIKKETITSDIPMDWLPKPKVEAEGFENNILSFAETETKTAILNLNTAVGQTLTGSVLRRSNQSIYKDEKRLSRNFQAVAGQSFLSSLNLHTSPAKFTNKLCKQTTVFYWQINDHILALLSR